jgi:hypothetical protein
MDKLFDEIYDSDYGFGIVYFYLLNDSLPIKEIEKYYSDYYQKNNKIFDEFIGLLDKHNKETKIKKKNIEQYLLNTRDIYLLNKQKYGVVYKIYLVKTIIDYEILHFNY